MDPRPVRIPQDVDVLPDMDGIDDLHSCLRTLIEGLGFRRGDVWYFLGCLPGKTFHRWPYVISTDVTRLSLPRTLPKSSPLCSDPMSPLSSACAGALASSSPLVSFELWQASTAILAGDFLSPSSGYGLCHYSLRLTLPLSRRGMLSGEKNMMWQEGVLFGFIKIHLTRSVPSMLPSHISITLREWSGQRPAGPPFSTASVAQTCGGLKS